VTRTLRQPSSKPSNTLATHPHGITLKPLRESKNGNNKRALEYLTGAKYIFGPKTALFDETFEDLGIKLR